MTDPHVLSTRSLYRLRVFALSVGGLVVACNDPTPAAPLSETATATASGSSAAAPPASSQLTNHAPPPLADEPRGDAAKGRELVETFQCNRCHDGTGLEPMAVERHCAHCHQQVVANKFAGKPGNDQWKKNVAHLTYVPSLEGIGARVRYPWLVDFVANPHDLRPNLVSSMPRLKMTREQARDMATHLTDGTNAPPPVDISGADLAEGRKLVEQQGCATCHTFDGAEPLPDAVKIQPREETRNIAVLALDLRHLRRRSTPAMVHSWLMNGKKLKPDTMMPQPELSPEQATAIVAYLFGTPLKAPTAHTIPKRLPVLDRRVGYDEVAKLVMDVTCRHCHGNPDDALGDGGPGNSGGFGFAPMKMRLSEYRYVQAGYVDDAGERHSIFEKLADGTPRLVASLWARHKELAGTPDPNVRGMPLGFPPLSAEEIQVVESWVEQGRPK